MPLNTIRWHWLWRVVLVGIQHTRVLWLTEVDGEDGQESTREQKARTSIRAWKCWVNMGSSLTDENEEKNKCDNPRIFLESVDHLEAEYRYQVR